MKPILLAALAALPLFSAEIRITAERRLNFNDGWKFHKGEMEGAEDASFSDAAWRPLNLPHDWAIEGPFDSKINPHAGALPYFGVAWYRKTFSLAGNTRGRYYAIEFDGAMANSKVWLNGHELGGRPYGYIGFSLDLTPYLALDGKPNVLAVRLAPEDHSSRWYPGAGIYRNVWLDITGPVSVARWGTYLTTPQASEASAAVAMTTQVVNRGSAPVNATLNTTIVDAMGKTVAQLSQAVQIPPGKPVPVSGKLTVSSPHRWDLQSPYLYRAISTLMLKGAPVDRYETPFGIRTIEFDKSQGFLLNGRKVKLQGVCLHHDLGALGTAVNRRATQRQLEIMQSMGVNAVRTSHNPPSPELLDLADQMGILILDEAYDMWKIGKVRNGLSKYWDEWGQIDIADMIRRDRNHPSIIMYSIGNEIPEQGRPEGWKVAKMLTEIAHREDPTRPTTAAFDQWQGAIRNELAANVDVPGFNYKPMFYETILRDHPNWIVYGSETASCVSSRGVYHLPLAKYDKHPSLQLTSYDIISPPWAYLPDAEFEAQEKFPNLLGEFVWTGFDYLGEPTPYFQGALSTDNDWPSRSSYFGIVDLAGFPKDRYYLYQSVWTTKPMVHLLPHWNWNGMEGKPIPVMAYTNADEVELFVNGQSLGRKKRGSEPVELPVGPNISKDKTFKSKYRLMWQVPYAAGSLRAVAYQNGAIAATHEIKTAGEPARITLIPDRAQLSGTSDLSFITVRIEDPNGTFCPLADNLVQFKVDGGTIVGVDNGNPATTEPFQANYRKAFNGLALVIVRPDRPGTIRVSAASAGLQPAAAQLQAR